MEHQQQKFVTFVVSGRHSDLAIAEADKAFASVVTATNASERARALGEAHRLILHEAYALNVMARNNPQYLLVEDGKDDHVARYMQPRQETFAAHRARYAKLVEQSDPLIVATLPREAIPAQPWNIAREAGGLFMMERPPGAPLYGAGEGRAPQAPQGRRRPGAGGR